MHQIDAYDIIVLIFDPKETVQSGGVELTNDDGKAMYYKLSSKTKEQRIVSDINLQ